MGSMAIDPEGFGIMIEFVLRYCHSANHGCKVCAIIHMHIKRINFLHTARLNISAERCCLALSPLSTDFESRRAALDKSGYWFSVRGSGPFVLGSWFLVLGSWFLVLGSWFLVLGSGSWFFGSSVLAPLFSCSLFFVLRTRFPHALRLLCPPRSGRHHSPRRRPRLLRAAHQRGAPLRRRRCGAAHAAHAGGAAADSSRSMC